jgi:hypothetical protein
MNTPWRKTITNTCTDNIKVDIIEIGFEGAD